MAIKNKFIKRLISTVIIATLAMSSVAIASEVEIAEEPVNEAEMQEVNSLRTFRRTSNSSEFKNFTLDVQYHQTLAREHASMLNDFRTSDTWYWNEDNETKTTVTGLSALTYDYDLEQVAMQRAAELLFRYNHTRPNDKDCFTVYENTDINGLFDRGENIGIILCLSDSEVNEDTEYDMLCDFREESYNYDGQGHRRNMLTPSDTVFAVAHASYGALHTWVQLFGTHNDGSTYTEPLDSSKQMTVEVKKSLIYDPSNIDFSKSDAEIEAELPADVCLVSRSKNIYNSKMQLTDKTYWRFIAAVSKRSNRVVIPNESFNMQTEHYTIPVEVDPRDTGDEISSIDRDNQDNYSTYNVTPIYNQTNARNMLQSINEFRTSDTWWYNYENEKEDISGLSALTYDYGLEQIAMQRLAELIFRKHKFHYRPDATSFKTAFGNFDGSINENFRYLDSDVSNQDILNGLKEVGYMADPESNRRNMLDSKWTHTGIAYAKFNNHTYFVQEFSDKPLSQTETTALNDAKQYSVRVYKPLISTDNYAYENEYVVIPPQETTNENQDPENGNNSSEENNNNPQEENSNPPSDKTPLSDENTVSNNIVKSSYKTKIDVSSMFSTPGAVKTKYKSSNKKAAKVNKNGIVTGGKKAGAATITKLVKYNKKGSWETAGSITIQNYYPKLPKKKNVSVGSTISMNSLISGMEEDPIKWESSKPSVVTISENGMAVALMKGSAKLTPVFSSGKAKVKTTIKVK